MFRRCTSTASGPRWRRRIHEQLAAVLAALRAARRRRMSGFVPRGRGAMATFSGFEADLLRSLASQLVELLRNEAAVPSSATDPLEALLDFTGPTTEPDDPVLARLFPTAYPDDEEAAGEFRRFTEGALRDGKARNAVLIIDQLE